MAKEKVTQDRWTCDASACTAEVLCEPGDTPAGYSGTVVEVGDWGGTASVAWFACEESHIRLAVLGAITRAMEET